jgi:hypothetical protein
MSFIRFRNQMINVQYIRKIVIEPTIYRVYCNQPNYYGFILAGSGFLNSENDVIVIDKEKDQYEYDMLRKWISTN